MKVVFDLDARLPTSRIVFTMSAVERATGDEFFAACVDDRPQLARD